jgi:hypothetical protein
VSSPLTPPGTGKTARDRGIEIGREIGPGRPCRCRQGTDDQPRTRRQLGKPGDTEMLELPAHPIAHHCAADLTTNHKTRPGDRRAGSGAREHPVTLGIGGLDLGIRQR